MRAAQKRETRGAAEAARGGRPGSCRSSARDHKDMPQLGIGVVVTGQDQGQGWPGSFCTGHGVPAYDDAPFVRWQRSDCGAGLC